jgi:cation diffusion facilitator CzcD-associated flavoprotein CzcO
VVVRDGKPMTLKPKQLVLATGMSAVPNMPDIPGIETFKGDMPPLVTTSRRGGAMSGRRPS